MVPERFKLILWSHDISKMDPATHRKTIITAAINYGDLGHWRWLVAQYGRAGIVKTVGDIPTSALRPPALRLAQLLLGSERIPHATRRPHA